MGKRAVIWNEGLVAITLLIGREWFLFLPQVDEIIGVRDITTLIPDEHLLIHPHVSPVLG